MGEAREIFQFKCVGDDEPLANDPFYAWLDANVDRLNPGRDAEMILNYLGEQGFVRGKHRVGERQFKILKYVIEVWCLNTPGFKPKTRAELFNNSSPTYYVSGERLGITPELKRMVAEMGWTYHVSPDTAMFEITNGRLYAKYQQIIGGRFICYIKEDEHG